MAIKKDIWEMLHNNLQTEYSTGVDDLGTCCRYLECTRS